MLVFLHGGNFQTGSLNEWPGHVLASRGLVVVTVNYRLGPFGFMGLGDTETGNYGLQVCFYRILFFAYFYLFNAHCWSKIVTGMFGCDSAVLRCLTVILLYRISTTH